MDNWYDRIAPRVPRVLQIGCDTEALTIIDIATTLLSMQQQFVMNAEHMSLPCEFDEVRAYGSLECADLDLVFGGVVEVLKRGGVFKFTVQRDSWWIRLYIRWCRRPLLKDEYITTKRYYWGEVETLLLKYKFKAIRRRLIGWGAIYEVEARK